MLLYRGTVLLIGDDQGTGTGSLIDGASLSDGHVL